MIVNYGEAARIVQHKTLNGTALPQTWTWKAAKEAEEVAAINCFGHGRAYLDGMVVDGTAPACDCNTCYSGSDCSTLLPNCSAYVISGDALFLEEYWMPQYAAIKYPSNEDVMLFSMSKFTEHSGSRFEYYWLALIKDEKVYNKLTDYVTRNSKVTSHDTHLRTLKLIKEVLSQINTNEGTGNDINEFGYQTLRKKTVKLNNLVSSSDRFSQQRWTPTNDLLSTYHVSKTV